MESIWLTIILGIAIVINILLHIHYKNLIEEKIYSLGGVMISCKRKCTFFGIGPFKWVSRNQSVYWFQYRVDVEDKEGWVRFGILHEPHWRL